MSLHYDWAVNTPGVINRHPSPTCCSSLVWVSQFLSLGLGCWVRHPHCAFNLFLLLARWPCSSATWRSLLLDLHWLSSGSPGRGWEIFYGPHLVKTAKRHRLVITPCWAACLAGPPAREAASSCGMVERTSIGSVFESSAKPEMFGDSSLLLFLFIQVSG